MNQGHNSPSRRNQHKALAALAAHKIGKKERYLWIAAGVAIVVLLLSWWARSSQGGV